MNSFFKIIFALSSILLLFLSTPSFHKKTENNDIHNKEFVSSKKNKQLDGLNLATRSIVQLIYNSDQYHIFATGFAIGKLDNKTVILTVNHFCEDFAQDDLIKNVSYKKFSDVTSFRHQNNLTMLSRYPGDDICFLTTEEEIPAVGLYKGDLDSVRTLEVVGSPGGLFPVIINSYFISALPRVFFDNFFPIGEDFVFISGDISPGFSGGPILDDGKVIGVISMGFSNEEGLPYSGLGVSKATIIRLLDLNKISYSF